jgi:hypothetical protein
MHLRSFDWRRAYVAVINATEPNHDARTGIRNLGCPSPDGAEVVREGLGAAVRPLAIGGVIGTSWTTNEPVADPLIRDIGAHAAGASTSQEWATAR